MFEIRGAASTPSGRSLRGLIRASETIENVSPGGGLIKQEMGIAVVSLHSGYNAAPRLLVSYVSRMEEKDASEGTETSRIEPMEGGRTR